MRAPNLSLAPQDLVAFGVPFCRGKDGSGQERRKGKACEEEKWERIFDQAYILIILPSVLWHCWLGSRKGIRPLKNWVARYWRGYLFGARCIYLHMVHLMPLPSCLAPVKSRTMSGLPVPFWCSLTQVVLAKRPLNGCSSSSIILITMPYHFVLNDFSHILWDTCINWRPHVLTFSQGVSYSPPFLLLLPHFYAPSVPWYDPL